MTMLDEDSDNQEDNGGDDEPELSLQRMLVVMMFMIVMMLVSLMLVRATLAMVFMKMCHIFANFGAKIRHISCNLVANYL